MKKILISLLLVLSSKILFGQENQSVFSNMSLKNKQMCNQLIPFWEKFTHMPESKYALLYHVLGLFDPHYSEDMENSVKKHGLLSANQKMNHGLRSVRQEIIYKDDPSLFNNALDREFDDVYFVPCHTKESHAVNVATDELDCLTVKCNVTAESHPAALVVCHTLSPDVV